MKFYCFGLYPEASLSSRADTSYTYTKLLQTMGFTHVKNPENADLLVCIDVKRSEISKLRKYLESKVSILIRQEPRIVCPSNYDDKIISYFDNVLDLGRPSNFSNQFLHWPQFWPIKCFTDSPRYEGKVILVSGNKISFIKGELYSLRRQCIRYIPSIAHYGTRWDISFMEKLKEILVVSLDTLKAGILPNYGSLKSFFEVYQNWLGSPLDKIECISRYKYSLVIENSADYLSEKLFDAFFGGTIPIYVGPSLDVYGIPSNLVIQCSPDFESVKEGISKAYKINYDSWREDVQKFLELPKTRSTWEAHVVHGRILEEIRKITSKTI